MDETVFSEDDSPGTAADENLAFSEDDRVHEKRSAERASTAQVSPAEAASPASHHFLLILMIFLSSLTGECYSRPQSQVKKANAAGLS
jgi:hypothetical protein